jgi:hypothetical protein
MFVVNWFPVENCVIICIDLGISFNQNQNIRYFVVDKSSIFLPQNFLVGQICGSGAIV